MTKAKAKYTMDCDQDSWFASYYRDGALCSCSCWIFACVGVLLTRHSWCCSFRATQEKCENKRYGNNAWYDMHYGGRARVRLLAYLTLRIPAAISLLSFPMMTGSDICFCAAAGFCCMSCSTWLTMGSPRICWISGSAIA